jgi:ribosome-associated protein
MLEINDQMSIPLQEIEFSYSRSPGPGGQNVNKVNSKVTLRWNVQLSPRLPDELKDRIVNKYRRRMTKQGELLITSHRFRDQGRNVAECLHRLRSLILEVFVPPVARKKSGPTRASKLRRLDSKRRRSLKKQHRQTPTDDG